MAQERKDLERRDEVEHANSGTWRGAVWSGEERSHGGMRGEQRQKPRELSESGAGAKRGRDGQKGWLDDARERGV